MQSGPAAVRGPPAPAHSEQSELHGQDFTRFSCLPSHIPLFPCAVRMRGQISRRKSVENFMHSCISPRSLSLPTTNWTHWLVIRLHFNCQSNRTTTRPGRSDKATERASEQGPNFTRTNISFNEMKCREGIFNDRTANSKLGPQLRFMETLFKSANSTFYC